MKSGLLFITLLTATLAEYTSYDGYKVYQIHPKNENELNIIRNQRHNPSLDFWSEPRIVEQPSTVMVTPSFQTIFTEFLYSNNIQYNVLIENVESTITEERARQQLIPENRNGRISFTKYNRHNEIQAYLAQLANDYPDIITLENIGTSTEGRPLTVIKISSGGSKKPVILVDGGIHAREWISPATVTYIIQELVENESNRNMIENTDWYILPVLNPDGYEYTHTYNRLWRKTRSRGILCYGVDGNRNFGYHWMEVGASSNQCDDTFAGSSAFSEPETAALRDFVNKYKDNIKLYLTFHSYGQYLLYPWGYTSALPDDAPELHALAVDVDKAIYSVAGTRYTIGSSTNVLYAAAGGSDDWVKAEGGVQLSYTIELPGGGLMGFDLPAYRILDVCRETFMGVQVYQKYIESKFTK